MACPRVRSQRVAKPRSELGLSAVVLHCVQKYLYMLLAGLRYRKVGESTKNENK